MTMDQFLAFYMGLTTVGDGKVDTTKYCVTFSPSRDRDVFIAEVWKTENKKIIERFVMVRIY